MVTKVKRVTSSDADQSLIKCRGCNRDMWHVRNNSPCWTCGYCSLKYLTRQVKTPRSKKLKEVKYEFKYQDLYGKVRWSRSTEELEQVSREVQELLVTEPAEGSLELREIIACGRELRCVFAGLRFDGGDLDE